MLFWGAQGIRRNIDAAVEYYRLGAESNDPAALYDYGILLLRVSWQTNQVSRICFRNTPNINK